LGATVAAFAFLVELGFLDGRKKLAQSEIRSLIRY
jgi:adenine/guanine phosphoribosyltransferase-like PRPP-binding protein